VRGGEIVTDDNADFGVESHPTRLLCHATFGIERSCGTAEGDNGRVLRDWHSADRPLEAMHAHFETPADRHDTKAA
jgi:hypothetical protein